MNPDEILISAVGFWRHWRTKFVLLFLQFHMLSRRELAEQHFGIKAAIHRITRRMLWWLFYVPFLVVGTVAIFAIHFPIFLFNKQSYREDHCQPVIQIYRTENHVVVSFEAWSVFLHPNIWCLRSIGGDWVICHRTARDDWPFVLIPKTALPPEWASLLSKQLKPKPMPVTAAA